MKALEAYAGIIKLVLGVVIMAALWYGFHLFVESRKEMGRAEVRAQYAEQLRVAKEASDKVENALRSQVDQANANANNRELVIKNLSTASSSASRSLHDALTALRVSVPGASQETLGKSTATLSILLNDCQARYRDMAEKADRHASDARTLSEAWPVSVAKP